LNYNTDFKIATFNLHSNKFNLMWVLQNTSWNIRRAC